jgi:hypothetical protein
MTTRRLARLALLTVTLTAGCASAPTVPSVLVLPAVGKSHEQFVTEDARCRQRAAAEAQTGSGGTVSAQGRYDMVYIQCMYAAGNQVPVPGGTLRSTTPATQGTPTIPGQVTPTNPGR